MNQPYPVRVLARPAPQLSRGLWLVKWFLLIPHAVVLFFLWVAFGALTVVAFFAILVTGRYPRALFDFNVGVLRWTWRVWFYGYYALGTDQYPPFTIADVPDYPARFEVDYPPQLSRGLVLVKTWLLAIPHYLVLSFFAGGGLYVAADAGDEHSWTWGGGLIVLLVLFGAVALLVRGQYPRPILDLVVGMDRWLLRVVSYAALMTDEYPPFRLDLGMDEPGVDVGPEPAGPGRVDLTGPGTSVPAGPATVPGWTAGRIIALTLGTLAILVGLGAGLGGGVLAAVDVGLRDDDGYLMSGDERIETGTYAISTEDMDLQIDAGTGSLPRRLLGTVKITATSENGRPVFLGIGRSADVADYLDGVSHAVVVELEGGPDHLRPRYRDVAGGAPTTPPTDAALWVAKVAGTGHQELLWEPESGTWTLVVMNADGGADVRAEMTAGATVPVLPWGAGVLLTIAAIFLLAGVLILVLAVRRAHASTPAAAP